MGLKISVSSPSPHLVELRLPLFPLTTRIEERLGKSYMTIAGLDLSELAREYGTPLYVYDRATLESAVDSYRSALDQVYPASSGLTYAGKAYLCQGIAQWAHQRGLRLDCSSAGEIAIAVAAGVSRSELVVHGVSKTHADLRAAFDQASVIVVDNLTELYRIAELNQQTSSLRPDVWLRLRPGVKVQAHDHVQTGQDESKFGLSPDEFLDAVGLCQELNIPLTGLHFHLGSQLRSTEPLGLAISAALHLINEASQAFGWKPLVFCPGGGWGVSYHEGEFPSPSTRSYVEFIAQHLISGYHDLGFPLPRLQLEPGRSLIAQAGVALYRVETVKSSKNRRWLLLDGGLADNPRPALYGARYTALPIESPERQATGLAWLGGPYCESGDVIIPGLPMPDVGVGEWVAVPVSGAYQLSMSSNYNGARRPAVLWLEDGVASVLQRRETDQDLLSRDQPLPFSKDAKRIK